MFAFKQGALRFSLLQAQQRQMMVLNQVRMISMVQRSSLAAQQSLFKNSLRMFSDDSHFDKSGFFIEVDDNITGNSLHTHFSQYGEIDRVFFINRDGQF